MKSEELCEDDSSTDSDIGEEISYSKSPKIDLYKPEYTYPQLIVQAILSSPNKQIPLKGIYSYISDNYPYFRKSSKSWQNSIRHNLSINRNFIKVPRKRDDMGLGSLWKLDSKVETKMIEEAFLPRRRLRFLRQPQIVSTTKKMRRVYQENQINYFTFNVKTPLNNESYSLNHQALNYNNQYTSTSQRLYNKSLNIAPGISESAPTEEQYPGENMFKNMIQAKCEIAPISPCEDASRSSSRTESVCSNQLNFSDDNEEFHENSLGYLTQNVIPIHNFLEVKISETSDTLHDWNISPSTKSHDKRDQMKMESHTSQLGDEDLGT